jgi:hypothetical protein
MSRRANNTQLNNFGAQQAPIRRQARGAVSTVRLPRATRAPRPSVSATGGGRGSAWRQEEIDSEFICYAILTSTLKLISTFIVRNV